MRAGAFTRQLQFLLVEARQDRRRVDAVAGGRQRAGEQAEQQQPECIDIGRGRDLAAAQLLGRGVGDGQLRGGRPAAAAVDQLGDAEVEQLGFALVVDQDVARLDVAMHDQVAVCMRDRGADLAEQHEARAQRQRLARAPVGDRGAVDVVDRHPRLPERVDAGVDEARDVGVRQPREDAAFAGEPLRERGDAAAHALDRDALLDRAVGAFAEPDVAHAAAADQPQQSVRPEPFRRRRRDLGFAGIRIELPEHAREAQQARDFRVFNQVRRQRRTGDVLARRQARDQRLHAIIRRGRHRRLRPCARWRD